MSVVLKWIVVLLAILNFGYMTFDGSRALIKGDYIRPSSGEYAGQLGPWTKLAKAVHIDPESTLMKSIFLVYGICGLIVTFCFAMNYSWAWKAMLIMNILSLWNLIFGTASSLLQVILLVILKLIK
ncbi:MAG: hypothetical protein ACXWDO_11805 [Bacteroidia bacterium]